MHRSSCDASTTAATHLIHAARRCQAADVTGCPEWGHARQQEVHARERHQVGGDVVEVNVEGALKAHAGGEVQQHVGGDAIHGVPWFVAAGTAALHRSEAFRRQGACAGAGAAGGFAEASAAPAAAVAAAVCACGNVRERLVLNGQHTVRISHQARGCQQCVVGRRHDMVVLGWKHRRTEAEHAWVIILLTTGQ